MTGIIDGYGSFGIIISNPRIPYIDESIEDITMRETSKIFYLYKEFIKEEEYYINRMSKLGINLEIGKENNYFIVPERIGKINRILTDKIYDIKEMKEMNEKISEYKMKDIYQILERATNQITFKRGSKITICNIFGYYHKIINIINCLLELYKNNLIYLELKYEHILLINNRYKLCDITSIEKIDDMTLYSYKSNIFLINYNYYIHPGIYKIYIKYLLYMRETTERVNILKIFNYLDVGYYYSYKKTDKYNECFKFYVDKFYNFVFNIFDKGIYKFIEFDDIIINKDNLKEILNSIVYEKIFLKNKYYYLQYFNFLYKRHIQNEQIGTNELIKELLCNLDLYSFGFSMIIYLIKKENIITEMNKNVLYKCIKIVLMCCLHYYNKKFYYYNINDILNYYLDTNLF
jgi:hypothetical protein